MKRSSFFLALSLIFLLAGCARRPITRTRTMMGTQVTVSIYDFRVGMNKNDASRAMDDAFREILRIENLIKWEGLRQLNDLAGIQNFDIGEELVNMIQQAYDLRDITLGAFDPDIGPITHLWGFTGDTIHIPTNMELDSVMAVVENTQFTALGNGFAYLEPSGAAIDLAGFAKGYAVDRACHVLQKAGMTAGIVEAGGDLRCFGSKRDGSLWKIAIRHPRKPEEYFTVITIDSGAVATSGDYERYIMVDSFRYHHIIDPETGFPAQGVVSSTVVASTCARADAFATGLFVLGPKEGLQVAFDNQLPALLIKEKGDTLLPHATKRFEILQQTFE